ncbi:MAG: radical SAM/SPASM domain-containing protein [Desulfuromonadaceae bacterium]
MYEVIILEPTLDCNLACPMCDRSMELRKDKALATFSPDEYIASVRHLFSQGREFYISGGEPTIWPGIVELCVEIINSGAKVVLQTNGTKPEAVRRLVAAGVTDFNLSIDGPRQVHNSIRGAGTYELMCETVEVISASPKGRFATTIVISDFNIDSVDRIFSSFRRDRIRPSIMIFELARMFDRDSRCRSAAIVGANLTDVPVSEAPRRNFKFPIEKLEAQLKKLQRLAHSYRRRIMFLPDRLTQQTKMFYDYQSRKGRLVGCKHRGIIRVDSQANVIPCFTFRVPFGNLLLDDWERINQNSVQFWNSLEGNNLAPVCETCFRLSEIQQ